MPSLKWKKILVLGSFVCLLLGSIAQCPTCVPDESCIEDVNTPNVCPLVLPDATAGAYYEQQITFYMPAEVTDPGTGFNATLISVTLGSITGVPFGLTFTANDEDVTYYPSAGENFGCATVCGTPLLPGTYDIIINVIAVVETFGIELTQPQTFASAIVVVPGTGSVNSFSFDNVAACGGLEVNYDALISPPSPSVTSYSWDFGNGSISNLANPATVVYDEPDTYTVNLTTTISDYFLNSVIISSLSDNWSDFDDFLNNADPYFHIIDGDGNIVYISATNSNTTSTSWTALNFTMSNPPYSLQFFDSDDISAEDDLGTTAISLSTGTNAFDIGNGTIGSVNITLDVTNEITDSTTVVVFPYPDPMLAQDGNHLYLPDPTLTSFTWYVNGDLLEDEQDSVLVLTEGGIYYAVVANEYGCTATSSEFLYCPAVNIQYDAVALELFVSGNYETYQWYFNGLPVDGATSEYYAAPLSGNYALEVTTYYGCETMSAVFVLEVGVEEKTSEEAIQAYPNPAAEIIFFTGASSIQRIAIYDLTGKMVVNEKPNWANGVASCNVSNLRPGVYFAEINGSRIRLMKK